MELKVNALLKNYIFLTIIFLLVSCSKTNKSKNEAVAVKPQAIIWFETPANYNDEQYLPKFQTYYDSCLKVKNYELAAAALRGCGNTLDLNFLPDSNFVGKSKSFLEKYESKISLEDKISISYYVGSQHNIMLQIDSSENWLNKTNVVTDDKKISKIKGFAGIVKFDNARKTGNLDTAMKVAFQNLALFEKLKDTVNISVVYNDIYTLYRNQKAYNEAEVYVNKSLNFAIISKDTYNIATALINKGTNAITLNQLDSLQEIVNKFNHYMNSWGAKTRLLSYHNYYLNAINHLEKNDLDSAEYYLSLCEKDREKYKQLNIRVESTLAKIDEKKGKPLRNIETIKRIKDEVVNQKDYVYAFTLFDFLANNAVKKGNYKDAFLLRTDQYKYRDSLWDEEKLGRTIEYDKKYEAIKKDKKILEQNDALKLKNIYLVLLASLVVIILMTTL